MRRFVVVHYYNKKISPLSFSDNWNNAVKTALDILRSFRITDYCSKSKIMVLDLKEHRTLQTFII